VCVCVYVTHALSSLAVLIKLSGREISRITCGGFFGEISVFLDVPRTADAVATSFTDCFVLSRADVDVAVRDYPEVCVYACVCGCV